MTTQKQHAYLKQTEEEKNIQQKCLACALMNLEVGLRGSISLRIIEMSSPECLRFYAYYWSRDYKF